MPTISEAIANALVHQQGGRLKEAEHTCRQILSVDPNHAPSWHLLGVIAYQTDRFADAAEYITRSVKLAPNPGAHNNLGLALHALGKLDEAATCYQRALEFNQDLAEVHNNLGNVFKDQGLIDQAIACYRRSLELNPKSNRTHSSLLWALQFSPSLSSAAIYDEHRRWNEQHAQPLAKFIQPHTNDKTPNRRLRLGYVSPDFRVHCQAFFTVPLFSNHDHRQFEIHCYSDVTRPDLVTDRLRSFADRWQVITDLTDEHVAALIRNDQIDILVDLTMHMERSRALVFAQKPAPVQVCWLAYPGTTGLSTIDYRLTDPHLDPSGLFDRFYSEESVRLPDTFWCYDPLTSQPEVNTLPALQNGYVTFGSLNNVCKVNPPVIKLWADVLNVVDRSRMILIAPKGSTRQRVLDVMLQQGIASERITFFDKQPLRKYMELYHQIDLCLDTFPYNGHTTSLDAFWMGVPVVTMIGHTVVGRAGLSQLINLGLPEFVADNADHFVRIAAELAGDVHRLSQIRQTLRARMQASPLMDAPRFARSVEAAYRSMWQRWCT